MNNIEAMKHERDGLDIKEKIAHYAEIGWETISEDDIQRLKWYGLFLRNPTPGLFMIRVRIPGGRTASYQMRALAEIASTYGNGLLDLTTRQQVQLRHIRINDVPAVFTRMDDVGLTSLQTGMDNVRNIMTCPVAGLSPDELLDATPMVATLTQEILDNRAYSNLPRKFNVAVTGCPDNCLHLETQDLALVPAYREVGNDNVYGFNVLAGGKLGSGGYRIASPLDIFVTPGEVLEVCRTIIHLYRDCGPRERRNTARLAFLLEDWGEVRFRQEVEARLGRSLKPAGIDARRNAKKDHVGIYRQKQAGLNYVGLKVTVGRITADHLQNIAALAERYGTGEIRLSPAQALIIPNVADRKVGALAEESLVAQFAYNPSPIRKGLVSCVGHDYCNLAVIETKSRAVETARALEAILKDGVKPITMHWSGCPAGCGNHLVADIGLLGKKAKVAGQVVDAVDVYVGGCSGPNPKLALKIMEDVPCDQLPRVLEGLIPYHTREKMHRAKGNEPKRSVIKPETDRRSAPCSSAPLSSFGLLPT
jgi:ferredoxin-nitrite reductase